MLTGNTFWFSRIVCRVTMGCGVETVSAGEKYARASAPLSSCSRIGLVRWPENPISAKRRPSPRVPSDVNITMWVSTWMILPGVSPSMSGICMSIATMANGSSSSTACRSAARATRQLGASVGRIPHEPRRVRRISRLVALSSTTRTRTPRSSVRSSALVRASIYLSSLTVKRNTELFPGSLTKSMPPSISLTSCLEMASPQPVPP